MFGEEFLYILLNIGFYSNTRQYQRSLQCNELCLSLTLDYEMNTLPSSTNEGAKFTSVVCSELEYEVPKLSLNKRKVVEIISNPSADDSPETKATQTGTTMENILWHSLDDPHHTVKRMDHS